MKSGEPVSCPLCGEKSVVKTKMKMDGFTRLGEVFVCALCGGELGTPSKDVAPVAQSSNKLAALLGEVETDAKADIAPDENYGRFCRNCVHFIEHPFKTLCGIDGKPADPMGECKHFKRKNEQA